MGDAQGLGTCRGENALNGLKTGTVLAIEYDIRHGSAPFLSVKVLSVKAGWTKDGLGYESWLRRCFEAAGRERPPGRLGVDDVG